MLLFTVFTEITKNAKIFFFSELMAFSLRYQGFRGSEGHVVGSTATPSGSRNREATTSKNREPEEATRSNRKRPKRAQEAASPMLFSPCWSIWRPTEACKRPPRAPKTTKDSPQQLSRPSSDQKHLPIGSAKVKVLQGRRTPWELSIGPKRPQ